MEVEDVNERIEWEAERIAAAFGIPEWQRNAGEGYFHFGRGEIQLECFAPHGVGGQAMTEQEAEVWEARLTRVWRVEPVVQRPFEVKSAFQFKGLVQKGIWIVYALIEGGVYNAQLWSHRGYALLTDETEEPFLCEDRKRGKEVARFAAQWLPFFRRGCWLSDCDIEASAHEKAEWSQGFSSEEIEAWNLKM